MRRTRRKTTTILALTAMLLAVLVPQLSAIADETPDETPETTPEPQPETTPVEAATNGGDENEGTEEPGEGPPAAEESPPPPPNGEGEPVSDPVDDSGNADSGIDESDGTPSPPTDDDEPEQGASRAPDEDPQGAEVVADEQEVATQDETLTLDDLQDLSPAELELLEEQQITELIDVATIEPVFVDPVCGAGPTDAGIIHPSGPIIDVLLSIGLLKFDVSGTVAAGSEVTVTYTLFPFAPRTWTHPFADPDCYVTVVWRAPIASSDWGGQAGAGADGIWPQLLVDYVETTSPDLGAADHLIPSCGVFQVDVYDIRTQGNLDIWETIRSSGVLNSSGNKADDSDILIGGGSGNAWKMVDEGDCDTVPLILTSMCYVDDDGDRVGVMRVRNETSTTVDFTAEVYGGAPFLTDGVATANTDSYFEAPHPGTIIIRWGGGYTGFPEQSQNKAQNNDPCHYEVTPDKEWIGAEGGPFSITLTSGASSTTFTDADEAADSVRVAFGGSYTVTEDGSVTPDGTYPVSDTLGTFNLPDPRAEPGFSWANYFENKQRTHTVTNVVMPTLNFQKIVCEDHASVRPNRIQGGSDGLDDTAGGYLSWGDASDALSLAHPVTPVDASELPEGCGFASGWSFEVSFSQGFDSVLGSTTTGSDGSVSVRADELFEDLENAIDYATGTKLWVREVQQPGYDFSALQCADDALHPDNLEGFSSNGDDAWCVAWNIEQTIDVEPDKVWDFVDDPNPVPSGTAVIGLFTDGETEPTASWTFDTAGEITEDSAQQGAFTLPFDSDYSFRELSYDVDGYRCTDEDLPPRVVLGASNSNVSPASTIVNTCEPDLRVHKRWFDAAGGELASPPSPGSTSLEISVIVDNTDGSSETVTLDQDDFLVEGNRWTATLDTEFGARIVPGSASETVIPNGYTPMDCPSPNNGNGPNRLAAAPAPTGDLVVEVCNQETPTTQSVPRLSFDAEAICIDENTFEVGISYESTATFLGLTGELSLTAEGDEVFSDTVDLNEEGQLDWPVDADGDYLPLLTVTLSAGSLSDSVDLDLNDIPDTCFPSPDPDPDPEPEPDPEPQPDPESDPDPEPQPDEETVVEDDTAVEDEDVVTDEDTVTPDDEAEVEGDLVESEDVDEDATEDESTEDESTEDEPTDRPDTDDTDTTEVLGELEESTPVTEASTRLPRTGSSVLLLTIVGALMAAAGLALTRRRTESDA